MKILISPHLRANQPIYRFVLCAPQKFARGGLASAAKKVRGAGRHGDDTLVHVNKGEFDQIRKAWGEPTTNPKTGLPEYFDLSSVFDFLGGPTGKLITSVVGGLLSSKSGSSGAQAPQVPGYVDPNLTTHLPQQTFNRTLAPNTLSPSDYYTYGQTGGEHQFFNNNSLADMSLNAPITHAPTTGSPAAAAPSSTGVVAGLGALKLLQNANQARGVVNQISKLAGGSPAAGVSPATGVSGALTPDALATSAAGIGDLSAAPGLAANLAEVAGTPALPASVFGAAAPAAAAPAAAAPAAAAPAAGALGAAAAPAAAAAGGAGAGALGAGYTNAVGQALGADLSGGAGAAGAGSGATGAPGLGTAALVAAPFLAMYLAGANKGQPAAVWSGRNDMLSGKIPDAAKPGMRAPPTGYPTWNAYNMAQSIVSDLKNGNSSYTADDWAKVNELAKKYNLTKDTVLPNIPMGGGAIYAHGGAEGGRVDQEKIMKMKKGGLTKAAGGGIMPSSPVAPLGLSGGAKMPAARSGVNWAPIMPHPSGGPRGARIGGLGIRHYSMRPRRPSMGGFGGMGVLGKMDQPVHPPQVDAPPMPMGMADGGPVLGSNFPLSPMAGQPLDQNWQRPMFNPAQGMPPPVRAPMAVGVPPSAMPAPMPAPMRAPMPMGALGQGWEGRDVENRGAWGGMRAGMDPRFGGMRPGMGMPAGAALGVPHRGLSIPGGQGGYPAPRPFMQTDPGYAMPQPPGTAVPYTGPIGGAQAMDTGGHVSGPGTGRSDQIPARLSDGEYVMDAETVNLLGDGSSATGAAKLDALRRKLRMHKGAALAQGKFSPAAKSPEAYMGKAGG
jgi:hypothetical protein